MLANLRSLIARTTKKKKRPESGAANTMSTSLQQLIAEQNARKKKVYAWQRGEPYAQPYHVYVKEENRWRGVFPGSESGSGTTTTTTTTTATTTTTPKGEAMKTFSVLSWNIDFIRPLTQQRMLAALKHLHGLVVEERETPCVILLQEMLVSDLEIMQAQPWVQEGYHLTDINDEYWEGFYGTCTLVPNSLSIDSVFRVHYERTHMERDGLFVDLTDATNHATGTSGRTLRICNTHLESLKAEPPLRPSQLQTAATFMHRPEVYASVLGGDLNAIELFDKTLHTDNDLLDAYLETGGIEDDEAGCTWGQMANTASRNRFGLTRMDKLLFRGKIQVEKFKSFGFGIEVELEQDRQTLIRADLEAGWVTDHLGVRGDFRIIENDSKKMSRAQLS